MGEPGSRGAGEQIFERPGSRGADFGDRGAGSSERARELEQILKSRKTELERQITRKERQRTELESQKTEKKSQGAGLEESESRVKEPQSRAGGIKLGRVRRESHRDTEPQERAKELERRAGEQTQRPWVPIGEPVGRSFGYGEPGSQNRGAGEPGSHQQCIRANQGKKSSGEGRGV